MKQIAFAIAFAVISSAAPAFAVAPNEMLADPALEARARGISAELRCLVCQNQSIDDSDADLAHDLRVVVRDRIKGGDSDAQVLDFIVARYGEFVLLRPRFNLRNALLWGTPAGILIACGAYAALTARRRRTRSVPPLTETEEHRLRTILDEG